MAPLPPVFGLGGILLAHVFFNLPLAVRYILASLDGVPKENWRLAASLGFAGRNIFRLIEWPYIRASLPGIAALIFMLCVTSFTVVLTLGGGPQASTLEVSIYQALRFDFDPGARGPPGAPANRAVRLAAGGAQPAWPPMSRARRACGSRLDGRTRPRREDGCSMELSSSRQRDSSPCRSWRSSPTGFMADFARLRQDTVLWRALVRQPRHQRSLGGVGGRAGFRAGAGIAAQRPAVVGGVPVHRQSRAAGSAAGDRGGSVPPEPPLPRHRCGGPVRGHRGQRLDGAAVRSAGAR